MADVFLSYARADSRDFVTRLSAALEERGKETWVDLDDIAPASSWNDELRAGIATSDSFCFVISPSSATSEICRVELDHAVSLRKRILPVLHLPVPDAELPEAVASRNWIPQTGAFEDGFDTCLATLVTAIETDLDWVREHTRWGLRAADWERRGEDRSVLARGSDLDQAEAFLSGGGGREPQPTELQGRYVLASRRAASRRQRQLVVGVSAALVVSLVLGVLALLQRNTAVEQRHEADRQRHEAETQGAAATSKALAANAFLNLPTDPQLSLLLGLEAAKASPTVEAQNALRSALVSSQGRLELRHGGAVNWAAYSPDGTRIATASDDGTGALWDVSTGDRIAALEGHTQPLRKVVWSADGSRIVTIAQDYTARVYDGATGEPVSVITDPDDPRLEDVAISADGSVVITAGFVLQQVRFWNADDGSLLGTIPRSTVDAIALSPDNSLLLVLEQGEGVELWSTIDASLVASYTEDAQSYFTAAAFSPDGSEFVTAGGDGYATVRAVDGTFLALVQHDAAIDAAAFSADGKRLATGSEDGTAKVTDIESGETLATFTGHTGPVAGVAFDPAGNLVASGGKDGVVRLWRPDGGAEVAALIGHQAPVNQVIFSLGGDSVLSASDDSTARVWSTAGSAAAFPQVAATELTGLSEEAFSPGGKYATVTWQPDGSDGPSEVTTFDVATGEVRGQFQSGDDHAVPAVSPDGELTVTSDFDKTTIRRTSDGSAVAEAPVKNPYAAAFDGSGDRVLVVGEAGQAGIYDSHSGALVTGLSGHDTAREVVGAAFSDDGSRAASASFDGTARVWDADSGKELLTLNAFGAPHHMAEQHTTLAFSPDGRLLATAAGYEEDAQLWDAATGDRLATLEGLRSGDLTGLAFSDDGRFIVTAPFSGGVRIWDGHSGRLLAAVTESDDNAGAVTFTGDSQIALIGTIGGQDSMAVLGCSVCGDLDSLVDLARSRVTRELTENEKATYLTDG